MTQTPEHKLLTMLRDMKVERHQQGTRMPVWHLRRPNGRGGTDLVAQVYDKNLGEVMHSVCHETYLRVHR